MARAKKILVVDDEKSLVQLCEIILEAAGYEVRSAYSIDAGANTVLTKETPVYDIPAKIVNYLVPTGSLQ